jgi:hypothetical protein
MSILFKIIIPHLFLASSIFLTCFIPFSYWAINADSIGKTDLGWSIFFGFSAVFATYASLVITALSLVLVFVYKRLKVLQYKIFIYSFLIGLAPVVFYLWLDYL